MIRVICVLTRITPDNVHLARSQIDDQCGDSALAIKRIDTCNVMVADRVRQVNVILLDRLQGFDRVR